MLNRISHAFRKLQVAGKLCAMLGLGAVPVQAQNLIYNGAFDINTPTVSHCDLAPDGWSTDSEGVQIEDQWNGNNWWIDLTNCDWGNFYGLRYLEQTIATTPGMGYTLKFDLGCWNYQTYTSAGVDVYLNGNFEGHYNYVDFTGNPLKWKKFQTCFVAESATTTVRFVCAAERTAGTPPGIDLDDYFYGVIVVGLDNVEVEETYNPAELINNGKFDIGYTSPKCNTTPSGWTTAPYRVQVDVVGNSGNPWVDMTTCNFYAPNTYWIQQTVTTMPGASYHLSYDVAASQWVDGGATLSINGTTINTVSTLNDGVTSLKWKTYTYDFTAATASTTIRFAPYASSTAAPVCGLDNVSLKQVIPCDSSGSDTGEMVKPVDTHHTVKAQTMQNVLVSAYPNPFSNRISFDITLDHATPVTITIYDAAGKAVAVPVTGLDYGTGVQHIEWNVPELPAGLYLYKVQTDTGVAHGNIVRQ